MDSEEWDLVDLDLGTRLAMLRRRDVSYNQPVVLFEGLAYIATFMLKRSQYYHQKLSEEGGRW